ncbi:hypothetical protein IAI10_04685 [Clostridium sp. 19966]|uniref:hypothetical protein n=1 Tax=Clostridium sp. 19966 TaxID=2768166 RepID=UPI0028DE58A6|nr:hypothetical protein [Clostridium sp. 19966]MDT8715941.1 hypothetical protein [Clostridium sp. 19966]
MKNKKMSLIIKVPIPIFIIGGCILVDRWSSLSEKYFSEKPVIVDADTSAAVGDDKPLEIISKKTYGNVEGFSANLGFIGDNEALVGIGMTSDEFFKKYPNPVSKEDNEKALYDISGQLYRLNLSTLEKTPIGINTRDVLADVLPNVKKVSYFSQGKFSIYDLKNNLITVGSKEEKQYKAKGNFSEDGNYYIRGNNEEGIELYDINKKSSKIIKLTGNTSILMDASFYSKDGKEIYFIGGQYKGKDYSRMGIFKINSEDAKITEVLLLPYNDTKSSNLNNMSNIWSEKYYVLDGGKKYFSQLL